ncbi:hypothetical protein ESY86_01300 [Subsaximicrobium wynnwilliamsii]|uniref:Lipocalin-like domain-containing protein n=1 Tax=Subsaximicrobium wynnwilliamsii TaxID=291179 RepID=A0A5C6ZPI4_9FLAO|nr:hypothetical protein [Subsaximicrobium wynnwilliamsii]TXD85208.1 hypothetical protein ESY87_02470 [Subsaximicrobium wynnwilliamsii]TXD91251.1 hypothetical protein ESY86_01300 [Subsaximicrobium wynnwilliamsii]TXE04644.1 hypothetical protein ESY88_03950 [Subsaximicrobium wynnwilliamsii]
MKIIQLFPIVLLLMFSCQDNTKNTTEEDPDTQDKKVNTQLKGAWELVGYYNYVNNKVTDSFKLTEGYKQVKMYTATKVMWSKSVPLDSTEWFGYGSYEIAGNDLTEMLNYGSEMMTKIIQEKREFRYELNLSPNKFSQIELDGDGNRIYSENYVRIE